ncbi:MAG: anti-sigma factor domain-containing protein, partial [Actinomycetota bacterium]
RGDGREATTATAPLRRRRVAFGALAGAVAVVVGLLVFVLPRGRAPETLTPEIVAILGSQSLANAPMQPTREIPNASGQVFYGGQTDSVAVIVRGLRDPGGLNYMLWLVVDGRAAPLGEFEVDEDGSSVILVKSVPDDLDGWLVTLEDSAETRVPEGRIILTSEETTLP